MSTKENYYFGNPQLFKMPKAFRTPTPPLTPSRITLGSFGEGGLAPYIVLGIAGFIAYKLVK